MKSRRPGQTARVNTVSRSVTALALVAVLLGFSSACSDPETAAGRSSGTGASAPPVPAIGDTARFLATTAAEEAVVGVLAYDHQDFDAAYTAAEHLLTERMATEIEKTRTTLRPMVRKQRASQDVRVVESGTITGQNDTIKVVLFIDQTVRRAGGSTNRQSATVVASMVHDHGDTWLVDELDTNASDASGIQDPEPGRAAAVDAAIELASAFTNLDHRTLDADTQAVLDLSTGTFHDQFKGSLPSMKKTVSTARSVFTSEVTVAALDKFTGEAPGDTATVLVATEGTVTNTNAPQGVDRDQRLLISLVNEDGEWLADDVTFVS